MKIRFSYILLHIFCFSLPLSEAIKNISWFLFIITWIIENRHKFNKKYIFKEKNIQINILFMIIMIMPLFVAIFCKFKMDEWDGAWDVIRYGTLGWMICHSSLRSSELIKLLVNLIASCVLTSCLGLYEHFDNGSRHIELNSVGHVNHSAIYLGLVICILLSQLLSFRKKSFFRNLLLVIPLILMGYIFFEMSARGAFVPVFMYILIGIYLSVLSWKSKFVSFSLFLIVLCVAYLCNSGISQKFLSKSDGMRPQLFNTSLVLFKYSPYWGIGLENCKYFYNYDKFVDVCKELEITIHPNTYIPKGANLHHAHNLYMQSLVERGILGSVSLILLILYWIKKLFQDYKQANVDHLRVFWGCSLAAFLMVFIGGIFNTTLHHEHGTLCIILFAFHILSFHHTNESDE